MAIFLSAALLGLTAGRDVQSRFGMSRIAAPMPRDDLRDVVDRLHRLRGGDAGKCDVVLVGCGVPKRGMGWYHGKQMLDGDVPSAKMTAVVEGYFLGAGADTPPGQTFKAWADDMASKHGTTFVKDISEVEINGPCLALISGRTADNPKLLKDVRVPRALAPAPSLGAHQLDLRCAEYRAAADAGD